MTDEPQEEHRAVGLAHPLRRRSLFMFALLVVVLALFSIRRFSMSTDISAFLPTGQDPHRAELSKAVVASELSRTLILTVDSETGTQAAAISRRFEELLRAQPQLGDQLHFVEGGPPKNVDQVLWETYQPRHLSFAAASVEEARALVSDAGLKEATASLKARLASPLSTLVSRVAPSDPFLAVPRLLEGLGGFGTQLDIVDGRFVAEDHFAVLLLGTRASALNADAQRPILLGVERAFRQLRAQWPGAKLQSSGLSRYSIRAQEVIEGDIRRITSFSILGMLALCLLLFRSMRLVLLTFVPIGAGMLVGTAASLALFGTVHGLTLAFGASLIGVCVDYVIHLYVHHLEAPSSRGPQATLSRIWPGLLLGASTTVVGFAVLGGSAFPGLRQVALFAATGIVAALGTTRWVLPSLLPAQGGAEKARAMLADALLRLVEGSRRRGLWLLPVLALGVGVFGAFRVRWEADLSSMGRFDAELTAEDNAVRGRVGRFDQSRFVIAVGEDEETALRANEQVDAQLRGAVSAQELGAFQGVGRLLPSQGTQRGIAQVLAEAELPDRLSKSLEEGGFNSSLFQPFFASLNSPWEAVSYRQLLASPLAPMVRPFRVTLGSRVGILTFLRDVSDGPALSARLAGISGVYYVDQVEEMREANRGYQGRVVALLWLGLALVAGLLAFRYRSLRTTLAAFCPALLAGGVTVAVLAGLDLPLNLLGLSSLLMVLSIGVDYGVFLAEGTLKSTSAKRRRELRATLLGLTVAWASTVFGFGLLAFSGHPALQVIGVVAAVGVTASLLLAPTALVLVGRSAPNSNQES